MSVLHLLYNPWQKLKPDIREDDTNWPKKSIVGKQELEIRVGSDHIAFEVRVQPSPFRAWHSLLTCVYGAQTAKIGSLVDVADSEDPEGLRVFYYLVQDLKVLACIPRLSRALIQAYM